MRHSSIQKTFEGHKSDPYIDPAVAQVVGCSSKWGSPSAGRAPGKKK